MLSQLAYLKGKTVDFLFPRWCVGCGREGKLICVPCRGSLTPINSAVCPRCGIPQPAGRLCPYCASRHSLLDGIRAPFTFEGTIRKAIHELKYRNLRALAPELARLLYSYLLNNPMPGDVLVPVPLHRSRLRERGYNQSALLAGELARLTGLPVIGDCLVRERPTPPQARTADVTERRLHMTGVFSCEDTRLRGKRALLIDDVSTSGATLEACASAAKTSGALEVWGLVVAREI